MRRGGVSPRKAAMTIYLQGDFAIIRPRLLALNWDVMDGKYPV